MEHWKGRGRLISVEHQSSYRTAWPDVQNQTVIDVSLRIWQYRISLGGLEGRDGEGPEDTCHVDEERVIADVTTNTNSTKNAWVDWKRSVEMQPPNVPSPKSLNPIASRYNAKIEQKYILTYATWPERTA